MAYQFKNHVMKYRCLRCGHEWIPRGSKPPGTCPGCKSPYWNKPRQRSETNPRGPRAPGDLEAARVAKEWGMSKKVAAKAIKYNVSPLVICPKCLKFLAVPAKKPSVERCTCPDED